MLLLGKTPKVEDAANTMLPLATPGVELLLTSAPA